MTHEGEGADDDHRHHLIIRHNSSLTSQISASPGTTVGELKRLLGLTGGARLKSGNKYLVHEGRTLEACGVSSGDTLHVVTPGLAGGMPMTKEQAEA